MGRNVYRGFILIVWGGFNKSGNFFDRSTSFVPSNIVTLSNLYSTETIPKQPPTPILKKDTRFFLFYDTVRITEKETILTFALRFPLTEHVFCTTHRLSVVTNIDSQLLSILDHPSQNGIEYTAC